MNVLLVNPFIYDFTAYDLWLRPLGLLYMASILEKYSDCNIYWLDTLDRSREGAFAPDDPALKRRKKDGRGNFHREPVDTPPIYEDTPRIYCRYGLPMEHFMEDIQRLPDMDLILVTSLMTYWIEGVTVTVDLLAKQFPSAKIVLGGILPTLVPHDVLKSYVNADIFIKGYGENQILELAKQHNAKIYPHPDLSHIDNLPLPSAHLMADQTALPLMTSRGCPFRCTYCASGKLNPRFIERTPQKILDEIYFMHDTYGTKHFAVFDDALLVNKRKRFLKVFQKVAQDLDVQFHTPNGMHMSEIDAETANILKQSGFKTMRLSLESTSDEILSRSSNKVTVTQMEKAINNLETAGYDRHRLGVYVLFGMHGQSISALEASLQFVKNLGVIPYLSYYSPVPATADFIDMQNQNILSTPTNPYETNKLYFLYNKSGLTSDQINHIRSIATEIMHGGHA